jgi:uncharacterized membrane protein HdeD (DUF308 family)
MVQVLARNWWLLALRGLAAIVFGIVAWVWPDLTLSVLIILFGAYALVDGAFAIGAAISSRDRMRDWPWLLLQGILGVIVGLVTLIWPDLTATALIYLIGAWALVTGVMQIATAIRLRREIEGELFLGLGGLASIIFGLIVFAFPGDGAVALVWLIGTYAIVFGIAAIILAFRLRDWGHRQTTTTSFRPST